MQILIFGAIILQPNLLQLTKLAHIPLRLLVKETVLPLPRLLLLKILPFLFKLHKPTLLVMAAQMVRQQLLFPAVHPVTVIVGQMEQLLLLHPVYLQVHIRLPLQMQTFVQQQHR